MSCHLKNATTTSWDSVLKELGWWTDRQTEWLTDWITSQPTNHSAHQLTNWLFSQFVSQSLTHLLTHSMVLIRPWEVSNSWDSQEISYVLWNLKVHCCAYRVRSCPYPEPAQLQSTLLLYLLKINVNIILTSLPSDSSARPYIHLCFPPCIPGWQAVSKYYLNYLVYTTVIIP